MSRDFHHRHKPVNPEYHERPKKIKIIKIPPGQAPQQIREQWVGVEIPLAPLDEVPRYSMGTSGGKPQNLDGYEVLAVDAIDALRNKSPEAYQYWSNTPWYVDGVRFRFKTDCCQIIE